MSVRIAVSLTILAAVALAPAPAETPTPAPAATPAPVASETSGTAPSETPATAPAETPAASATSVAAPADAGATPATAAGHGRVRGVVTDPEKKPVGGRLVVLVSHAEGEALRVTSTDEKGRYQFRDLPPGIYEIRLEAEGFDGVVKKGIDVRPPFQNVVDVTLRRSSPGAPARAPAAAPSAAPPAPDVAAAVNDPAAPADPAGTLVQGTLRDSAGAPVVEAEVLLAPLAAGALHQGVSDEEGAFRIEGVAPGGYRLMVRSLGHVPIDVSRVDVARGSGLVLRLTLVDYALNFVSGGQTRPVQERPRPRTPQPETP